MAARGRVHHLDNRRLMPKRSIHKRRPATPKVSQALLHAPATWLNNSAQDNHASPVFSDDESAGPFANPLEASASQDLLSYILPPRPWIGQNSDQSEGRGGGEEEGIEDVDGSMEQAFQDFDLSTLGVLSPVTDFDCATCGLESCDARPMWFGMESGSAWGSVLTEETDCSGSGHVLQLKLSLDGRTRSVTVYGSSDQIKQKIASALSLDAHAPFILRSHEGLVVPMNADVLADQAVLSIERISMKSEQTLLAEELRPWDCCVIAGAASLQFVQEPPKDMCEWLTCKVNKSGEPRPLQHLFAVEVKVSNAGKLPEAELCEKLMNAQIRLFTPSMQEKTHLVHQGSKVVTKDEHGTLHVRWPAVGIKEVSSTQSGIDGAGKLELGRAGGRCAAGWYHMAISAGDGIADLWLRSSTDDAGLLAKIVVKHKRCYKTGRWEAKGIGPYADHCFCTPSHVDANGQRLCREGRVQDTAAHDPILYVKSKLAERKA